MLAFRSEAHVDGWCRANGVERGAVFAAEQAWALAQAWYKGRLDPGWRRRTPAEAERILASAGLTGPFWRLV
jgi:hypothetical protein